MGFHQRVFCVHSLFLARKVFGVRLTNIRAKNSCCAAVRVLDNGEVCVFNEVVEGLALSIHVCPQGSAFDCKHCGARRRQLLGVSFLCPVKHPMHFDVGAFAGRREELVSGQFVSQRG